MLSCRFSFFTLLLPSSWGREGGREGKIISHDDTATAGRRNKHRFFHFQKNFFFLEENTTCVCFRKIERVVHIICSKINFLVLSYHRSMHIMFHPVVHVFSPHIFLMLTYHTKCDYCWAVNSLLVVSQFL